MDRAEYLAGTVALIPARGGSKRLPRKNVAEFLGRPIIAYTIEAALACGQCERVVVSTEDEEIAAIAARFGATVSRRPAGLAGDEARVVDVCIDFLDRERAAGRAWRRLICLYATAPLRAAADIDATARLLEAGRCDFAIAVTRYDLPPHQALILGEDGGLTPMWPDLVNRRGSEMPVLRVDNGSTYAVDVEAFRRARSFYGPGMRGYDMDPARSIDIDTEADLERARWLAQRLQAASAAVSRKPMTSGRGQS